MTQGDKSYGRTSSLKAQAIYIPVNYSQYKETKEI